MSTSLSTQQSPPEPATTSSPAVAVDALTREFDERPVLRDVSFRLETGASLAVLGPNGSGKTTLLRILATLLRPTEGEVRVLGAELPRGTWQVRGRVGFIGHDPLLYRDLTLREALTFHARLHRIDGASTRIADLLAAVRLDRAAGELVRNLSAGMLQRAAACRALLHEPELLLLDEPFDHLDPAGREAVSELVAPATGRTRVLVSHDVEAALEAADRVLALRHDGSVAFEGPSARLSAGDARAIYAGRR